MDPKRILQTVKRRWMLLVGFIAAGLVFGGVTGLLEPTETPTAGDDPPAVYFESAHTLRFEQNVTPGALQVQVLPLTHSAERTIAGEVPIRVAEALGMSVDEVSSRIRVHVEGDLLMTLVAVDPTATGATTIVDEYAGQLIGLYEREADRLYAEQLALVTTQIGELEGEIADLQVDFQQAQGLLNLPLANDLEEELSTKQAQLNRAANREFSLELAGEAVQPLRTFIPGTPYEINEEFYEAWIRTSVDDENIIDLAYVKPDPPVLVDPAATSAPLVPGGPTGRAALFGVVAGVVGLAGLVFLDKSKPTILTADDVERAVDLPVLVEVPALTNSQKNLQRPLAHAAPRSNGAEAHRQLLTALEDAEAQRTDAVPEEAAVVMVTSAGASEAKTTTAANLAAVLGTAGLDVLALNCDFRRPTLHRRLGAESIPQQVVSTRIDGVSHVSQVTADDATANPIEVIDAQRNIIERSRGLVDVVLLDTAPLLAGNDTNALLAHADHVLVTALVGKTTVADLQQATALLDRRLAPVLGVVLVGSTAVSPGPVEYLTPDRVLEGERVGLAKKRTVPRAWFGRGDRAKTSA